MKNKKAPMLVGEELLPDIDDLNFKELNRQSKMTQIDKH